MQKTPLVIAAGFLLAARSASAQGSLAGQGFGYPTGQLATRSLAMGGALAEFDPQSTVNPAALGTWGPAGLYVQYDPEFRTTSAGGADDRTTVARFPIIAAALPVGDRGTLGASASTFLDRSWVTRFERGDTLRGQPVASTEGFRSEGAVNDVRVGGAFALTPTILVGVGVHAFTGENRLEIERDFRNPADAANADTVTYGVFLQRSTLSYSGTAFSAGVNWRPVSSVSFGASARRGGSMRTRRAGSTLSTAQVPDRYGAAVRYDGIAGTTLAARVNWEGWSSMAGLSRPGLPVSDALEYGVGADVAGPRIGALATQFRLGARVRDLPFGVREDPLRALPAAGDVRETAFSAGAGLPLAGGRAIVDVGVQRASRSSDGRPDAEERAWTASVGLRVRP